MPNLFQHTEVDQIVGFNSNENENPAKCPPCSVDNVVIENIPTPEMVRRHRITEAAEIDFENGYDSDKVMRPFLDAIEEEGAQLIEEVEVPEKSSEEEEVEKATDRNERKYC